VDPRRLVPIALLTQAVLVAASAVLTRQLDLSPKWGDPRRDVPLGIAAAALLAAANYGLLARAPSGWLVDGVRMVYRELLVPVFGRLGFASIVMLSAVAGFAEEWLFRGVLQPMLGLAVASVAFGLAHVAGRRMLAFGVWATGMGAAMGGLADLTGGLTAPMVAHGVYDVLALLYIRRRALHQ
jgi:hypothetical protein